MSENIVALRIDPAVRRLDGLRDAFAIRNDENCRGAKTYVQT